MNSPATDVLVLLCFLNCFHSSSNFAGMVQCQLPTGEYPESTVLPTVDGRYNWDSLVFQALVDKSHRSFSLKGYLVFRFPDSAKEQLSLASSIMSAPLVSNGFIVVSQRVRTRVRE